MRLSPAELAELAELDAIAPRGVTAGTRYPEAAKRAVNR
jgi:hypothetical protein